MDWQAFWLTIRLATVVTGILLALGLPLAYWIAFSRWRWKFLVEAVVALPIVLPPTVLGFLRADRARTTQPIRTMVAVHDRTHAGLHLQRAWSSDRCSTACRLRCSRSRLPFRLWIRGCWRLRRCWARRSCERSFRVIVAAVGFRAGDGNRAELRAHHGRIRRRAHGRRKYSWRHAHALHQYFRSGAGFELCGGEYDCAGVGGDCVCAVVAGVFAESQVLEGMATTLLTDAPGRDSKR